MRLRSFFLWLGPVVFSTSLMAQAEELQFENIEELSTRVKLFAEKHFIQIYGKEKYQRDVRLRVSNLDRRLKLRHCDKETDFELIRPAHQGRNVTVKAQCNSDRHWSIYVPITLEVYADVVVATRNLGRGAVISDNDVKYQRINTAGLPSGHLIDKNRILGMELKRSVRVGSYLLLSSLEKPRVVNKGDSVVLEARQNALQVSAKGTALNNGQVGEQIKVRNNQSDRVVDAMVTGPGRVMVVSR